MIEFLLVVTGLQLALVVVLSVLLIVQLRRSRSWRDRAVKAVAGLRHVQQIASPEVRDAMRAEIEQIVKRKPRAGDRPAELYERDVIRAYLARRPGMSFRAVKQTVQAVIGGY